MSKGSRHNQNKRILREQTRRAFRTSMLNLKEKPRKPVTKTFLAFEDGPECPRCFAKISKGERVRYNPEGELVHFAHKYPQVTYEICQACFLTKPCDCED